MDDTTDNEEVDQSEAEALDPPPYDPALAMLVQFFNAQADDSSIGITLNVAGAIVTGQLVGITAWFGHAIDEYAGGDLDVLSGVYKGIGPNDDEDVSGSPNHIHLEKARMFMGDKFGPVNDTLRWRGRLSEVAGWTLGEMSSS